MMRFIFALLLSSPALAAQYVVNQQTGSDSNPTGPFATIQKCADLAAPGDSCLVSAGVYREEVTPKSGTVGNPITFSAATGESVRVTGLDVSALSWTDLGGGVYSATATEVLDIFRGTQYESISQQPNYTDYMSPAFDVIGTAECQKADLSWSTNTADCENTAEAGGGTSQIWRVTSTTLDETLNWTGGIIGILHAAEYSVQRATIISSDSSGVVFSWIMGRTPEPGWKMVITNSIAGVDADGEWAFLGGTVYYKPAGGTIPTGLEIKTRELAFNLKARASVTVDGFDVWAASIETDSYSIGNTINDITASYIRSFEWFAGSTFPGQGANRHNIGDDLGGKGITLAGKYNVLSNSTVENSWCDGVTIYGGNHSVINTSVSQTNWGFTNCGFSVTGQYQQIWQNSIFDCARTCTHQQYLQDSVIAYNDIYNACLMGLDCGVLYSYNYPNTVPPYSSDDDQDGIGNQVHHNWIHDTADPNGICLYLDNNERDYLIHHNVIWGCKYGITLNDGLVSQGDARHKIYNNTIYSISIRSSHFGGDTSWALNGIEWRNNLSVSSIDHNFSASSSSATMSSNVGPDDPDLWGQTADANWTDGQLVLEDMASGDYRPATGSPAIDVGEVIRGITDNAVGTPDAGAYESGTGAGWRPGAQ